MPQPIFCGESRIVAGARGEYQNRIDVAESFCSLRTEQLDGEIIAVYHRLDAVGQRARLFVDCPFA